MRQSAYDNKRAHDAREAIANLPKHRMFEVKGADGRILRHRANNVHQLRAELVPGYTVIAEVFGFAQDGTGGISVSTDASVPTLLDGILQAFGAELLAWLSEQGVVIRHRTE